MSRGKFRARLVDCGCEDRGAAGLDAGDRGHELRAPVQRRRGRRLVVGRERHEEIVVRVDVEVVRRPVRGLWSGALVPVVRGKRDEPDLVVPRVHGAQEGVEPALGAVELRPADRAGRTHRARAVEDDHHVRGLRRAPTHRRCCLGLDRERRDAEQSGKEGLRRRHLEHDDGVAGRAGDATAQRDDALRRHGRRDVVDVGLVVLAAVLGAVLLRDGHGIGGVRKLLRAGECSGVGGGLERAVRVIGVADVDDQRCETEQHDHHQHHENDDLTALVLRFVGLPSCLLVRNHCPEPPQSRRVRTTPIVFQLP